MTESKLTTKQCISYASGLLGQNALLVVMGFLMVYYTDAIGISAAAAGTVILVGKIWDAVTDPIMGLIVDRTKTRWGEIPAVHALFPAGADRGRDLLFQYPRPGGGGLPRSYWST